MSIGKYFRTQSAVYHSLLALEKLTKIQKDFKENFKKLGYQGIFEKKLRFLVLPD